MFRHIFQDETLDLLETKEPVIEIKEEQQEVKVVPTVIDEPQKHLVTTKPMVETTTGINVQKTEILPVNKFTVIAPPIKSVPLTSSAPPINVITQQDTSGLKLNEPEPNVKAPDLKIERTTPQDAVPLKKPPDKPLNEWTTILSKYNRDKEAKAPPPTTGTDPPKLKDLQPSRGATQIHLLDLMQQTRHDQRFIPYDPDPPTQKFYDLCSKQRYNGTPDHILRDLSRIADGVPCNIVMAY